MGFPIRAYIVTPTEPGDIPFQAPSPTALRLALRQRNIFLQTEDGYVADLLDDVRYVLDGWSGAGRLAT
jgi:hypothetical protein